MNKISSYNEVDIDSLKSNYKEALKDKGFKDFIMMLNLDNELLMKYTSLLEDSYHEYGNCLNCKNILECKNKMTGLAYLPKVENNKIVFQYKKCKYKKKLDDNNKYLENIYTFEVNSAVKEAKMKDIYMDDENRFEIIKYLKNFINAYEKDNYIRGLYLSGTFGSGKSYLIAAMFNELAKKGYKSAMIFWPNYLRELKNFDEFNNRFEQIKNVPLLLIDDIGAENLTDWARDEVLCPLLQYRMDEKLTTFFTSNLNMKELEEHLSLTKSGANAIKARRIINRIGELTIAMDLISKNLRNN